MNFLSLRDLPSIEAVLTRASELKAAQPQPLLAGKSIALVFEKASTRTRMSFQTGAWELGVLAVEVSTTSSHMGRGEPLADTARVLSGYVDAIVFRTGAHERMQSLADAASIPVINGLTDWNHPCQLLADLLTVREAFGRLSGLRYAWVGDGNNMAHSWLHAAGLLQLELVLACPQGYRPDESLITWARDSGANVDVVDDPVKAVESAQIVSTDVWASMGQETEREARERSFAGYCVDAKLLSVAAEDAIVLHCLPAYRGLEISADVIDGAQSCVWAQAENRKHAQKALLCQLLGK